VLPAGYLALHMKLKQEHAAYGLQQANGPEIEQAARALEQGRLVGFPTETVYGLGADAENPQAVANIYRAKGRPSNHPVIVHLSTQAKLEYWASEIPEQAEKLIKAFWPGPLTLILRRASHIPDSVSGGQDSIGLRCPSHPVAQALLLAFKQGQGGIAAPSANKFGHVSPTMAQHVRDEFGSEISETGLIATVLEGGQSEVGIESTILDLTRLTTHGPVLLRPGHISAKQISAVLGQEVALPQPKSAEAQVSKTSNSNAATVKTDSHAAEPRVSGSLDAHYAPDTPVVLLSEQQLLNVITQLQAAGRNFAVMSSHDFPTLTASDNTEHAAGLLAMLQLGTDPVVYAHQVYAALRTLDQARAEVILVEALPQEAQWQGVNDRLQRAAFDSSGVLAQLLMKQMS